MRTKLITILDCRGFEDLFLEQNDYLLFRYYRPHSYFHVVSRGRSFRGSSFILFHTYGYLYKMSFSAVLQNKKNEW